MSIEVLKATCFSQDRKNQGNNFAYLRGQRVPPEDERRGKEVINLLSRVTARGVPTHISDLVKVYITRGDIVVDARVQETDVAGRRAGIIIQTATAIPAIDDQALPDLVRAAALRFAEVAELTLTEQTADQIAKAVQVAQKKTSRIWFRVPQRRQAQLLYVLIGLLLLAVVTLLIVRGRSWKKQELQQETFLTSAP